MIMKCIVLPEYNANIIRAMRSLEVREKPIPRPGPEEVLIKVAAAPCNPSDIAFMRGGYSIRKTLPAVMGFECSGTVVDAGNAPQALTMIGKRVSAFTQGNEDGTWAEYFRTHWKNCIGIRDDLDFDQAGTLCVNPFTAYALYRMAAEKGIQTILQNGASGQVGVFIRTLARRDGMKVINIVRKAEHIAELKKAGERYVLNSADPGFEHELVDTVARHGAGMAFDAVGGDLSGLMINAMPAGATLVIYGGLSGKPVGGINTLDIIFRGKTVMGFNLGQWKTDTPAEKYAETTDKLQELIIDGTIATRIQGRFGLAAVQTALEQYIRNMSSGKILFTP